MTGIIVQTSENVTLLGGGTVSQDDLSMALGWAPVLVAADGGADVALARGYLPDAVVGDLDSISQAARARIPGPRMHEISEQETTDFDKCLKTIRAPLIIGVGFLAPRLDHQLAALSGLMRRPESRCILVGADDIAFLCPRRVELRLEVGARLSLFPFGPFSGRSRGLKWPIDGIEFAPGGRIGTSNAVVESDVVIEAHRPNVIVVLPRTALGAAVQGLVGRGEGA